MKHRARSIWIVLIMAACALGASAQGRSPSRPQADSGDRAVATVGGMKITRAAFEQRVQASEAAFRAASSGQLPAEFRPVMRRQVLEAMIREHLMILEARRRGMSLTAEQAEEELKKDPFFRDRGGFDEAKFLAVKASQPERFRAALAEIQAVGPARRLKEQLDKQNSPDRERIRSRLSRELSEVTIEYLALRRSSFRADQPNPSEAEVIAYHRAHAHEFQRPEEARISLLLVNQPPLPLEEAGLPDGQQAWESRMRAKADSLLSVIRRGGSFDDVAASLGGAAQARVTREAFPPTWRGNAQQRQAVFSASAGTVLSQPVRADGGFMIVRVDHRTPAGPAPLRDVVGAVRTRLRSAVGSARLDRELRALYDRERDALRGAAHRIRYAVADTGTWQVPEPSAADLDRYYRGHLADYSFFDATSGTVGSRPLSEVREDVRARWLRERRAAAARAAIDALRETWKSGKRDPRSERAMSLFREVGPVPSGGVVDTGLAGAALTDTLARRAGSVTMDAIPFERGLIVYHIHEVIRDYLPTFDQVRPMLAARQDPKRQQEEEAAARRLYEENPSRFASGRAILFSRVMVSPPELMDVPLTREEVEAYYNSHPESFGAPALARVRHILIAPEDATPQADAAARREAEEVARRVRAGESFAALAKKHSDDEPTRDNGGDVGVFRRGQMLDQFEAAAFAMDVGEIRGPVKTEVGYHVMECLEQTPAEVVPLKYCYPNVAVTLAKQKAQRIARFRADSLRRAVKTPGQALAAAKRHGFLQFQNEHVIGSSVNARELVDYFARVERLKPRQFDDQVQEYRGMGFAITWVDSLLPPRAPSWEQAREQALTLYRSEGDRRMMLAKRDELDSLQRAGWSFDSLATLFGGFEGHGPAGPGQTLSRLGGTELLDSLAFGTRTNPPVLSPGKVSDWIEFPAGLARLRLVGRSPADPVELAARVENETRVELERNLRATFARMKQRFPVEIHDADLRVTELPPLADS